MEGFLTGILVSVLVVSFAVFFAHSRIDKQNRRIEWLEKQPETMRKATERVKYLVVEGKAAFIIEHDRIPTVSMSAEDIRLRINDCFPKANVMRIPPSAILTPLHPEIKAFLIANSPAAEKKSKKNS